MAEPKVEFKDLSGWLKFGAISSIAIGIIYCMFFLIVLIEGFIF